MMTRGQKAWQTRMRNQEKSRLENVAKMDFEVRRVAAAFGCAQWWEENGHAWERIFYGFTESGLKVRWHVAYYPAVKAIYLGKDVYAAGREVGYEIEPWFIGNKLTCEYVPLLARAFYCLGFEESGVEAVLPLSAHEKMELRLRFPREYWPPSWVEEEMLSKGGPA